MRLRLRKQPTGAQGVRAVPVGASTRPVSRAASVAAEVGTPSVARWGRRGAPRSHLPNQRVPRPGPRAAQGPRQLPPCQPWRTERSSGQAAVPVRWGSVGLRLCISNRLPSRGPARITLCAPVAGASKHRHGEVGAGSEAVDRARTLQTAPTSRPCVLHASGSMASVCHF